MEFSQTFRFVLVIQMLTTAGLVRVSFAERGVDRDVTTRASVQQEVRAIPVEIEGPMSCVGSRSPAQNVDQAVSDPTQGCDLTVHDNQTDRDYHITGSSQVKDDAMTLFRSGKRSVRVEGRSSDNQTLVAYRISTEDSKSTAQ